MWLHVNGILAKTDIAKDSSGDSDRKWEIDKRNIIYEA